MMGTETDRNSSNPSEIQTHAEFESNNEPVAELDERIAEAATDDGADDGNIKEPDLGGNSSDEEEAPAAKNNTNDFTGLDEDEIDDGIDSQPDEKQGDSGEDPAPKKALAIKDPGNIKKLDPKKEPLPKSTANSQKGKKSVAVAATSKKIIVSIIILFMVVGALIYYSPALFSLKGKPENALPVKAELKTPVEQAEIQNRQPEPPGKNDPYLSKIEDITRLRDELLAKKEEIYRLKLHYRNGIDEMKDQIFMEIQDGNVSTFAKALQNKRIELGLRTIQRREAYIQELEKPDQWVHNGSEELLFLKRKALLDLHMTEIASGIDLDRHMRDMTAAHQKYQPSADKLAVDPPPAELTPLETIWRSILNQQAKKVQAPLEQKNRDIIAEICSGNYGRIAELTAMTPEAARCLARINGAELFLNGLTQLSPKEAEYLFKWQGNWICLNSLKNLSPAVAKHLFKWEGNWVSLNGLTELPPELALYLTKWNGNQLELMGLSYENLKPDKKTLKYLALWETMGGKLFVSDDIRNEMARLM